MNQASIASRRATVGLDVGALLLCVVVFWLPLDKRSGWSTPVQVALIAVLAVGMLLRSRAPLVAFGLVGSTTFVGAALQLSQDPFIAAAWTLYPVAVSRSGARFLSSASAVLGLLILSTAVLGSAERADAVRYVMVSLLALAGAWALGRATRRQVLEVERRVSAEKDRAIAAERLRVVREVHDVVSHSLGTIAVAAGVAARVDAGDAGRMREKLQRIESTGKEALDDLRAALGALRDDERADRRARLGEELAERRRQLGPADLAGLVDLAKSAGTRITLTRSGLHDVPPAVGLAVYRITQEGVTNAVRHAPGARCEVIVVGKEHEVVVEVNDDGAGSESPPAQQTGYGLVGLRERVELLGGTFSAGHLPGGGFQVRATIPFRNQAVADG